MIYLQITTNKDEIIFNSIKKEDADLFSTNKGNYIFYSNR